MKNANFAILTIVLGMILTSSMAYAYEGCQPSFGCGGSMGTKAGQAHNCWMDDPNPCDTIDINAIYSCTEKTAADELCKFICNAAGSAWQGQFPQQCTAGTDPDDRCLVSDECLTPATDITVSTPNLENVNPGDAIEIDFNIGSTNLDVPEFGIWVEIPWLDSGTCDSVKETVTINGHAYETEYNDWMGDCVAIVTPEFAAHMTGSTLNSGTGAHDLTMSITTDHATVDTNEYVWIYTLYNSDPVIDGNEIDDNGLDVGFSGEAPACDPTPSCSGECRGTGYSNDGGLTCYDSDACTGECDTRISFSDRYGSELSTGTLHPSEGAHFTNTVDGITTTFYMRNYSNWEYDVFPLGRTVDYEDNFFGEFRIRTPSDFQSAGYLGGGYTGAGFGFTNGANSIPAGDYKDLTSVLMVQFIPDNEPTNTTYMQLLYYDQDGDDGPDASDTTQTASVQADKDYIIKMSYNSTDRVFTVNLYDLDDGSLVDTVSADLDEGTGLPYFSVDSIGIFPGEYVLHTGDQFLQPWTIYSVKANSDGTEKGQTVIPQSGLTFQWATDNSDATKTSKIGLQSMNVLDSNGDIAAVLDLNLDNAPLDIKYPTFTTGFDDTQFRALLHSVPDLTTWKLSHPGLVLDDSIYVPINPAFDISGIYHCPFVTTMNQISTSCLGRSYSIDKTLTTINGIPVAKIPNQGGGSGPGCVLNSTCDSACGGVGTGYSDDGITCYSDSSCTLTCGACTGNAAIDDPRCYEVTIGNASVQVYDPMCYDETNGESQNVTLNAFSTMTVLCNATVYHEEGCQAFNGSLTGNVLKLKFFDDTQDNTTCTADDSKNCYINISCAPVGSCTNLLNQTIECTVEPYYNANNTTWTGWFDVMDIHLTHAYANDTIPINNLNALNVTNSTLNLGTLSPGANTSTHPNGTNIENGGNIKIDLNLNGTSVFTCPTPPNIGIGNLSYNLSSAAAYGITALTATATPLNAFNLDSAAGSAGVPTATNKYLYWGMGMPMSTVGGQTCSATIRVAAIMDQ